MSAETRERNQFDKDVKLLRKWLQSPDTQRDLISRGWNFSCKQDPDVLDEDETWRRQFHEHAVLLPDSGMVMDAVHVFERILLGESETLEALLEILYAPDAKQHYGLEVPMETLALRCPGLCRLLLHHPTELLPSLDEAVVQAQMTLIDRGVSGYTERATDRNHEAAHTGAEASKAAAPTEDDYGSFWLEGVTLSGDGA
ncbi:MAG: hypothetical protein MHM6MM_008122, partial [Cercozoa sp. M6MM]